MSESLASKSNEEIDACVAVEVMGWTRESQDDGVEGARDEADHFRLWAPDYMRGFGNFWSPSTDISDAWTVVEKMRVLDTVSIDVSANTTAVRIGGKLTRNESHARAISEAALSAIRKGKE